MLSHVHSCLHPWILCFPARERFWSRWRRSCLKSTKFTLNKIRFQNVKRLVMFVVSYLSPKEAFSDCKIKSCSKSSASKMGSMSNRTTTIHPRHAVQHIKCSKEPGRHREYEKNDHISWSLKHAKNDKRCNASTCTKNKCECVWSR